MVLTLPFWLGRAGRISRPSWRQPAANKVRAAREMGRATSRRTTVEPTWRLLSIAFTSVKERLCLLTVHAHPDDEASKGAPTMAMYKAEGVHTVLVCCTGGEEGDLQNPALREPGQPFHGLRPEEEKQRLAELRPDELARSAEIIGFDEVVMLGYRDSGMADTDPNHHPESFHQAPIDEAVGRLVAVIRAQRAEVIITYGDDQSGYPHPDHLKVHDISVLALERAGDPAWYPELGEPYQPQKLYYTVWAKARLMAIHEAMIKLRGESPYDEEWLDAAGPRPSHHDPARRRQLPVGPQRCAAGARHAGRSHRAVVVRADRRGAGRRLSVGGLDPGPLAGRDARRRGVGDRPVRRDQGVGVAVTHPVPGRVRQEGRGRRGPRRRRCRRDDRGRRRRSSIRRWRTCRAS